MYILQNVSYNTKGRRIMDIVWTFSVKYFHLFIAHE